MKNIELVCEAQVKLGNDTDEGQSPTGVIEARATTWGAREGADGRKFNYQPEGFAQWAESFAKEGKPMPMFLNHNDMGMPVGQWDEIAFDDEGMTAKGKLFMETSAGADVYHVLKESPKLFGGVSVGAFAEEAQMVDAEGNALISGQDDSEAFFQITKGGLREISVVMYPNNPNAEVMKLEYFDAEGHANPRLIEKALREAGISRKVATTATSIFKKILEQKTNKDSLKEAPPQSEAEAVVIEADELLKALKLRELSKALSKRIS